MWAHNLTLFQVKFNSLHSILTAFPLQRPSPGYTRATSQRRTPLCPHTCAQPKAPRMENGSGSWRGEQPGEWELSGQDPRWPTRDLGA